MYQSEKQVYAYNSKTETYKFAKKLRKKKGKKDSLFIIQKSLEEITTIYSLSSVLPKYNKKRSIVIVVIFHLPEKSLPYCQKYGINIGIRIKLYLRCLYWWSHPIRSLPHFMKLKAKRKPWIEPIFGKFESTAILFASSPKKSNFSYRSFKLFWFMNS